MTAYDRSAVIRDLQDCRREIATLKREYLWYYRMAEAWRCKAVAATCVNDEECAEMADAFAMEFSKESNDLFERHAVLLKMIRILEKELTK